MDYRTEIAHQIRQDAEKLKQRDYRSHGFRTNIEILCEMMEQGIISDTEFTNIITTMPASAIGGALQ